MKCKEIINVLRNHSIQLSEFGVKSIAVFGSAARDELTPSSDVDILVEFSKPVGLFTFVRLKRCLEELLGREVDLITPDALKDKLRERILEEAVYAA